MRNKVLAAVALAVFSVAVASAQTLATDLKRQFDSFHNAVERHDMPALRAMMATAFTLTHVDGQKMTRTDYLHGVEVRQDVVKMTDITSVISNAKTMTGGASADVTTTSKGTFMNDDGKSHNLEVVETTSVTWTRSGDHWLIASIVMNRVVMKVDGAVIADRKRT